MSVSDKLRSPFAVEEKDIRKFREIIETRISAVCSQIRISLQARFSDNTLIETEDIDTILNVKNNSTQTINYISLATDQFTCLDAEPGPKPKIRVEILGKPFEHGLSYSINGSNRDWVYLSQSDISQYMKSMVIDYGLSPFMWGLAVSSLIMFLIIAMIVTVAYRIQLKDENKIANSKPKTLDEVLWPHIGMLFPVVFVIGAGTSFFADQIAEALWPSANFLIGDGNKRYENLSSIRHTIAVLTISAVLIPSAKWMMKKFFAKPTP